jgi:ribosomal protein S18 acetylase RimI-like enzyme
VAEGHRQGVGARLLTEAERRAREWANHLVLLATTDNTGARRFYERLGYRHVGDLPRFAVPGLDEALPEGAPPARRPPARLDRFGV